MTTMFGDHMQDLLQQKTDPEPGETRELTVEEALQIAIQLQQDARLEEARVVYNEILAVDPSNPRALHFSGVLAHQLGHSTDAVELIQKSLSVMPDVADWHSNLGIVLQESGHLDEAIEAYQRAIALDPDLAEAYFYLGMIGVRRGNDRQARLYLQKFLSFNPPPGQEVTDARTSLKLLGP